MQDVMSCLVFTTHLIILNIKKLDSPETNIYSSETEYWFLWFE